jgi:glycosyltransferase involved in cell wall biosynthesis
MRVLWFTNTPSLASEYLHLNSQGGGWISSLEKQIAKINDIQLGVAFHHGNSGKKKFVIDKTQYYLLPNFETKGKIKTLARRWKHQIEPDSFVDDYIDIVKEFKPDLIHIFGSEQAYGLIIDRINIPVVIQIQGNITVTYQKWFSGISNCDILRFSNFMPIIRAYGLWHDYFYAKKKAKREQKMFKACKFFIGRTDWDMRITKALSVNGKYFHCDELMRDVFYHNQWTEPKNQKLMVFSTIKPNSYKGLESILVTAAILKNKQIMEFEWRIAGISEKDEIVRITEKAFKLKFNEQNIYFNGILDQESLLNCLLLANCYIHPSHIENSPNSVCEAMLLGMPIIATYAGGTPSILKDGQECILIQDGDPFALAGAILEFLENQEQALLFGVNARKRALVRHNPERVLNDVLSIYSSILSVKPNQL